MSWLKEPLLHFLALGGLVFAAYYWTNTDSVGDKQITITLGQQENLRQTFARTWQRPPTQMEFEGLLRDLIREELAYRESQVMALDANDIVIRRRLRQKLELLTEDLMMMSPPSRPDLETYLATHTDDFRLPAEFDFEQIYFRTDADPSLALHRARQALVRLQDESEIADPAALGDRSLLAPAYRDVRSTDLSTLFGSGFDVELMNTPLGVWSGPVRSGYGYHLVRISRRTDSRIPLLEEVTEAVQRDFMAERRRAAVDGLYERLAANYRIEVQQADASATTTP